MMELLKLASSAEFYNCVDKDGNIFITDNPPQNAKCESKGGDDESASQQQQSDIGLKKRSRMIKRRAKKERLKDY
jgi:hypothetical protein